MRIGTKKTPFYRVVVVDERAKRTGAYIELLGSYNPLTEPKDIKLKKDRIDYWIKQGAQPSTGYLRMIGKAPQRLPRKPKKERKQEAPTEDGQTKSEEAKPETEQSETTNAENPATEEQNTEAVNTTNTQSESEEKHEGSA